tara:strand:+ start:325 stop:651 length:327 start_codon:yes stop_codon:yes gene_type:complete
MNNGEYTITINDSETIDISSYSISDISLSTPTITYDSNPFSQQTDTITIDNSTYSYANILDNYIDPVEVDRMCKEYPALSKVWRNFKSVYDMTLQDYKGKKDEGEIYE